MINFTKKYLKVYLNLKNTIQSKNCQWMVIIKSIIVVLDYHLLFLVKDQ